MPADLTDFSRLCLHTMTTRPWSLEEALHNYAEADVPYVTVWREHLEPYGPTEAAKLIKASGRKVASYCRGGFFVASSGREREEARNENRKIIDEAAEIGAPLVVLVCGADPDVDLYTARQQILDGIHAIEPHAKAAGVKLGIEPLHPMYADSRSAVNTLDQANNMVMALGSEHVGVVVDVYHLWWDPFLRSEIDRCKGTIFGFHVCDWRTPTRDLVWDRGLMGEGCINIREIRDWVEKNDFNGPIEVEIFSEENWEKPQDLWLKRIKRAYLNHV